MVSLSVDQQSAEVARSFNRTNIQCILLKGPSIARWLYVYGTSRPYGDSDLLVPPHAFEAATQVLIGLGFRSVEEGRRPSERTPHATTYVRTSDESDLIAYLMSA